MGDYHDTFNTIIGTSNEELDLHDNPYIQINIYELDHNWTPKLSTKIKLRQCQQDELLKFASKTASLYYKNSLCFENKSTVTVYENWFQEEFNNFYISVDACN